MMVADVRGLPPSVHPTKEVVLELYKEGQVSNLIGAIKDSPSLLQGVKSIINHSLANRGLTHSYAVFKFVMNRSKEYTFWVEVYTTSSYATLEYCHREKGSLI